jgi:outer membrane protein
MGVRAECCANIKAELMRFLLHGLMAFPFVLGIATHAGAADLGAKRLPEIPQLPAETDPNFYIHGGFIGLAYPNSSARMTLGGAPFAGASAKANPVYSFAVEAGYFVNKNIAVSVATGAPPTTKLYGTGTALPFGKLGKTVAGPITLTAHYHFVDMGWIQPYVGVGVGFLTVIKAKDAAIAGLQVQNAAGFALQAGVDIMLSKNWGMFVDVKQIFLETKAKGFVGPGIPASAKLRLDPIGVHTGITYRF